MKSISDIYTVIYEEGEIVSTPANTMGMGNPMPAGVNGDTGSEPLPEKKKKKSKKCVKEGVLDIEGTLANDENILKFANLIADADETYTSKQKPDFISDLISGISFKGNGEFVIDINKLGNRLNLAKYEFGLYIPKTGIPDWLKKITFLNAKRGVELFSYVGDMSSLELEIYNDDKKSYSDIYMRFKSSTAGKHLKLGKVVCMELTIDNPLIESITINEYSEIISLDLHYSKKLINIYGNIQKLPVSQVALPRTLIINMLKQQGIIPWSAELKIL